MWIPVAIGIQFLLLYIVLGGPGRVLAGFSGQRSLLGIDSLGRFQIGLPVAMVLAFPSLATLAAFEKWVHPVGWLDIVVVQGLSLILMLRRLRRSSSIDSDATGRFSSDTQDVAATTSSTQSLALFSSPLLPKAEGGAGPRPAPESPAVMEGPLQSTSLPEKNVALSNRCAAEDVPTPTPTSAPPSPQEGAAVTAPIRGDVVDTEKREKVVAPVNPPAPPLEVRQLVRELAKIYGWNRVGLERPFVEVRQHIRSWERGQPSPDGRVASWRRIARDTLSALRQNGGALPLEEFFSERVMDADEYERDVMRRLSLSVLVGHDRLFIDPSDLEMCGEDMVVAMYRQALLELGAEGGVTYH